MKKHITILSLLLLLVASCSKDERTLRQFDGSWNIDSYDDYAEDASGTVIWDYFFTNFGTVNFDKKTGTGSIVTNDGSENFTYDIAKDGTQLKLTYSDGTTETYEISNYDKKKSMTLTLSEEDGGDFYYNQIKLSKK
jgi:hypothetical protein